MGLSFHPSHFAAGGGEQLPLCRFGLDAATGLLEMLAVKFNAGSR